MDATLPARAHQIVTLDEFAQLSPDDQAPYFRAAADTMGLPANVIQKDFWVTWLLQKIFLLDSEIGPFTFKGGTSLSKCYNVITRFSEDIDLGVERKTLRNAAGEFYAHDAFFYEAPSKTKRLERIAELNVAAVDFLHKTLAPRLRTLITAVLGDAGWTLERREDGHKLYFVYPQDGDAGTTRYTRPEVLIEFGTLDAWPTEERTISAYLATHVDALSSIEGVNVRVLDIGRTFWEKVVILHQYAHLPEGRQFRREQSRHYYDVVMIARSSYAKRCFEEISLLGEVARYKDIFYPVGYARYDLAADPQTLVLTPPNHVRRQLEPDYVGMVGEMIFPDSTPPTFTELEHELSHIQDRLREPSQEGAG